MLCKSGGFTRSEIGVIQISAGFTHVELKPHAAEQLMAAAGAQQVIDDSIWVDRSAQPEAAAERPPFRKDKRSGKPRSKVRSNPEQSFSKAKAKKPRTGPKKPRGPNGEKKRSKK